MKQTRNRRRRGFTLVEMLVVLAILVLLVSMVVPRIIGSQKKADLNAARAQIGLFKGALEQYQLDCKKLPTTEQGFAALQQKPADLSETATWGGPYLTGDIPKDPWGHEYQYEYPPSHGTDDFPDIWSTGPDGDDTTEENWITSWTSSSGGSDDQKGTTRDRPTETRRSKSGETRRAPPSDMRRDSTPMPSRGTSRPASRSTTERKAPSPL